MDFKGITWVGNVYQKFEAMCLDVEEIIVQDTAKYVENQVQSVGNTVKKFYSDVVQDLLPDDDDDDGSVGSGKALNEFAPVCSFKKSKGSSLNRKTKKEQDVSEGKKDGCEMKLRGLDADDYYICTSPRQYGYGGPYRRTRLGRKQTQCSRPYMQKTASNLSMGGDINRVKDDVGTVKESDSPPGEVERLISKEECQKDDRADNHHGLTVVNSVRGQDSENRTDNKHGLMVVNSVRGQDSEIRTEKEHGLMVVNSVRGQDSEIRTEKEHGLMVVDSVIGQSSETRTEKEHGLVAVDFVRSQDSEIQTSVATSLPAGSDDCRKEMDEDSMQTSSSSVSEQKPEILEQLSDGSVEETCIIVERDEFHCVFPDIKENDKHKPYKKIRDAISSRMKQNREKEYKRLARQWYAEDVENGRECGGEDPKPVDENRSTEESEWELL